MWASKVEGAGSRIEGNTLTANTTGIDLTGGANNYFAKNLLQGSVDPVLGSADDADGGSIAGALSNIILP